MGTRLEIMNDHFSCYSRDPDPDDDWDAGDLQNDISVKGIRLASRYYNLETELDVAAGDYVHLLYVVYSTGSTFGRADGNVEYVDVFRTHEEAAATADVIRAHYEEHEKARRGGKRPDWSFQYINDGIEKSFYAGAWIGYFEYVEDVVISDFIVKPEKFE